MDDNVLRTYTTPPTEAKHHIQFEQGEDRWLCTLLLQQGYKIDYCAGADALTFAPETFNEFFIQRRRWSPSTMANIIDLLSSWSGTVRKNENINSFYMLYQSVLMMTSVLAPAAVAVFISGAFSSVLGIDLTMSFYASIAPIVAYIIICMKCSSDIQLKTAALLSSAYAIIMVFVTIGTILNVIEEDLLSPNVLFLIGLAGVFVLTALCHPQEFGSLFHGLLYYLTVPTTFILLTVYFITNINNVSWGTREKKTKSDNQKTPTRKGMGGKVLSMLYLKLLSLFGKIIKVDLVSRLSKTKANQESLLKVKVVAKEHRVKSTGCTDHSKPDDKYWIQYKYFSHLEESTEKESMENTFWNDIINKYLLPLKNSSKQERAMKVELDTLRNNVVFGFFLLNLMFAVALFQIQLNQDRLVPFFVIGKYDPVSLMFLGIFILLLFIQFISMLIHRIGTFLHLLGTTSLRSEKDSCEFNYALDHTNILIHRNTAAPSHRGIENIEEIEPDYDHSDVDEESIHQGGNTISFDRNKRHRRQGNGYATLFRRNFSKMKRLDNHGHYRQPYSNNRHPDWIDRHPNRYDQRHVRGHRSRQSYKDTLF